MEAAGNLHPALLRAGPASAQGIQGHSQLSSKCLHWQRLQGLPGSLLQCLATLTLHKFFLPNQNITQFKAPCPLLCNSEESSSFVCTFPLADITFIIWIICCCSRYVPCFLKPVLISLCSYWAESVRAASTTQMTSVHEDPSGRLGWGTETLSHKQP